MSYHIAKTYSRSSNFYKTPKTEDDGAGGPVRRVPFEAYEAITYQEGVEVRDGEKRGRDVECLDLCLVSGVVCACYAWLKVLFDSCV